MEWSVSRKTDIKDATGITRTVRDIELPPYVNGEFNPVRISLVDILSENNGTTNATILLQNAFPKFLKVTDKKTDVVRQLMRSSLLRKLKLILSE